MKTVEYDFFGDRQEFLRAISSKFKGEGERVLYFDVSEFCRSTAHSGIQRVVFEYLLHLPEQAGKEGFEFVLVSWDETTGKYIKYGDNLKRPLSPKEGDIYFSVDLNADYIVRSSKEIREWKNAGCKTVAMVYDLVYVSYPQTIASNEAVSVLTQWLDFILSEFDGILAISETVMREAIYYARGKGIPRKGARYSFCHLGVEFPSLTNGERPSIPLEEEGIVKKIVSTGRKNFISVSTVEPRKGYVDLISAFEKASGEGLDANLIIVGRSGWKAEHLVETIRSSKLYGKKLFWFDNAADNTLDVLYSISNMFVIASYYEGFGLGIIEAASRGLPVLARDIPVFREICGEKAVYFDDTSNLAKKFGYCIDNLDLLSKAIIAPMSWEQSVLSGWAAVKNMCFSKDLQNETFKTVSSKLPKRVCILSYNLVEGDAVSNAVFEQKRMLERMGYFCEIFTWVCDPRVENRRQDVRILRCGSEDLIIDHISGYTPYVQIVVKQPCRKVFFYHNVTPVKYFPESSAHRAFCEKGLEQIPDIIALYDFIAGVSAFNLRCLKEMGNCRVGDVLPLPVEFPYEKPGKREGARKSVDFLFVGRVVPNKRFEDIIDTFAVYHKKYNPDSRLTLVGNKDLMKEYTSLLESRIRENGLSGSIRLTGKVSDEELQKIYKSSDVFLCMSEHEGFCVPLVEAMYNGLAVFAYDACAVPETVAGAGIIFKDKSPENVAKLIFDTLQDESKREMLEELGKKRAEDFAKDKIQAGLYNLMGKWLSPDYKREDSVVRSIREFIVKDNDVLLEKIRNLSQVTAESFVLNPNCGVQNRVKRFVKRLVRKLSFWILVPILERQKEFNESVVLYLERIRGLLVNDEQ